VNRIVIGVLVIALMASLAIAKDKPLPNVTTRGALDCSEAISIGCNESTNGSTVGMPNNVSGYSCIGWDESGGEMVYEMVLDDEYVVNGLIHGMGADLDIFFLDGCEENNCIAYGNNLFTTTAGPGTYYIVVDGFNGAEDYFALTTECDLVQDPAPPFAGGDTCAEATDFQQAGVFRWSVDLTTYTDTYDGGGCFSWHLPGGDAVYKMDLEAGENFSATLDGPCDISMYIFGDCYTGVALACADSGGSGGQEVLDFDAPGAGTYYLVLDTFQTAGCEVIVNTESAVAVKETSWSTVKTLFR